MRKLLGVAVAGAILFGGQWPQGSPPPAQALAAGAKKGSLRSAVAGRLRELRDFSCSYLQSNLVVGNPGQVAFLRRYDSRLRKQGFKGGVFTPPPGAYRYRCRLFKLGGDLRVVSRLTKATVRKELAANRTPWLPYSAIRVLTHTRSETLSRMSRRAPFLGTIAAPALRHKLPLLWALGILTPASRHMLGVADLAGFSFAPLPSGRWSASLAEVIGPPGRSAVRVTGVWHFSAGPRPRMLSFKELYGKFAVVRIACSGFRRLGGLSLPTKVSARYFDPSWGLVGGCTLSHIRYRIRPAGNVKALYRIKFPAGTVVHDERVGRSFVVRGKPSYLTDHDIYEMLKH